MVRRRNECGRSAVVAVLAVVGAMSLGCARDNPRFGIGAASGGATDGASGVTTSAGTGRPTTSATSTSTSRGAGDGDGDDDDDPADSAPGGDSESAEGVDRDPLCIEEEQPCDPDGEPCCDDTRCQPADLDRAPGLDHYHCAPSAARPLPPGSPCMVDGDIDPCEVACVAIADTGLGTCAGDCSLELGDCAGTCIDQGLEVGLCVAPPNCDPLAQDCTEGPDPACATIIDDGVATLAGCALAGPQAEGEACFGSGQCEAGLACVDNPAEPCPSDTCCTPYCDTRDADPCSPGECLPLGLVWHPFLGACAEP